MMMMMRPLQVISGEPASTFYVTHPVQQLQHITTITFTTVILRSCCLRADQRWSSFLFFPPLHDQKLKYVRSIFRITFVFWIRVVLISYVKPKQRLKRAHDWVEQMWHVAPPGQIMLPTHIWDIFASFCTVGRSRDMAATSQILYTNELFLAWRYAPLNTYYFTQSSSHVV